MRTLSRATLIAIAAASALASAACNRIAGAERNLENASLVSHNAAGEVEQDRKGSGPRAKS